MSDTIAAADLLRASLAEMASWRQRAEKELGLAVPRISRDYANLYDFIAREGQVFEPVERPEWLPQLEPRHCHDNAIAVAEVLGIRVIQGYAYGPAMFGMPVWHSWNAPEGEDIALESTFEAPGQAYLGVEIPLEAARWPREYDVTALDNWLHNWPLLQRPWRGPEHCDLEPPEDVEPPEERDAEGVQKGRSE